MPKDGGKRMTKLIETAVCNRRTRRWRRAPQLPTMIVRFCAGRDLVLKYLSLSVTSQYHREVADFTSLQNITNEGRLKMKN